MNISEIYEKDWDQENYIIIDVRSPQEYADDHIIGSINLPVLYDEEYNLIGRIYKKKSAFEANIMGAQLVMKNISNHLGCSLKEYDKKTKLIFCCKKGGNRSFSFYTVCEKIGWRCEVISGGYRSYRQFVVKMLEKLSQRNEFVIISGRTGNGKTKILNLLELKGLQVIDLEDLACHRGSILGSYTNKPHQHKNTSRVKFLKRCGNFNLIKLFSWNRKAEKLETYQSPTNFLPPFIIPD